MNRDALVRIEILEGRPSPEKQRLLQAVHAALGEAFEIPTTIARSG